MSGTTPLALVPSPSSLPAQCPLAACSEEQGPCQNPLLLKGQKLVGGHGQKGGSKPSKVPGRQEWTEARNSRQAAQRTPSGYRKGRTVADPGPYLSRGASPSSCWYSPGLQATLGQWGCSQVLRGPCQHGSKARQCKLLGIVWGREGGGEGEGALQRQAAVSTCLLPAPLPQNRFGQSGTRGGWNNGSPMPPRGSEGPQTTA